MTSRCRSKVTRCASRCSAPADPHRRWPAPRTGLWSLDQLVRAARAMSDSAAPESTTSVSSSMRPLSTSTTVTVPDTPGRTVTVVAVGCRDSTARRSERSTTRRRRRSVRPRAAGQDLTRPTTRAPNCSPSAMFWPRPPMAFAPRATDSGSSRPARSLNSADRRSASLAGGLGAVVAAPGSPEVGCAVGALALGLIQPSAAPVGAPLRVRRRGNRDAATARRSRRDALLSPEGWGSGDRCAGCTVGTGWCGGGGSLPGSWIGGAGGIGG